MDLAEDNGGAPLTYSPVIVGAVLDLARSSREEMAGPRMVEEALRLWQRSGWSESRFVAALQLAQRRNKKLGAILAGVARQVAEQANPPE